jgi:wyosine [tRNA(Phe)-imidazoG37] synthetase (radical SAM superfamily)
MAIGDASGRYVYGPVPSRRLGRSLGVDLVPFKTCPYDCIYCQLGRTTDLTLRRAHYVPLDAVVAELEARIARHPTADYIGLAGSGEPTLHAGIGDLIDAIKRMTDIPVAVLTNGALLWMPEVRDALAHADLVMPSLDAGGPETFRRVNRPVDGLDFNRMVEGLVAFTAGFRGRTWLEVFVLRGITDGADEIDRIAALADRIRPDRVQLNTVARPTAEVDARRALGDHLDGLCRRFRVPCEVIADVPRAVDAHVGPNESDAAVLALLARRPCTVEGIATGLDMAPNDVVKHLDVLEAGGRVTAERRDGAVFYRAAGGGRADRPEGEWEEG